MAEARFFASIDLAELWLGIAVPPGCRFKKSTLRGANRAKLLQEPQAALLKKLGVIIGINNVTAPKDSSSRCAHC